MGIKKDVSMEEFIAGMIQDGGYAAILIVVLHYFFSFIKKELENFTTTVRELVETTNKLLSRHNELQENYNNTITAIHKAINSLEQIEAYIVKKQTNGEGG